MTDLLSWLRSALDEHERLACGSTLPIVQWYTTEDLAERLRWLPRFDAEFMAAQSPAHVLRTVQAHREILDRHGQRAHWCLGAPPGLTRASCPEVLTLARVYQDHPGLDPDWLRERS